MTLLELIKKDRTIRGALFFLITTFILIAFVSVFGFTKYYLNYYEQRFDNAIHRFSPVIKDYSDRINLFATSYIGDTAVATEEFDEFAELLIGDDTSIESIYYSPNGDISNIYPANPTLIGQEVVTNFSLEEFSRFSNALNEDGYFLTYVYKDNTLSKLSFNKSIVVDGEFSGLVTIVVDVETFIQNLPPQDHVEEFFIQTEDNVFLLESVTNDDNFNTRTVDINGHDFVFGSDFRGSYYQFTVYFVMITSLFVITPFMVIFVLFLLDKQKTLNLLRRVEYSQSYSTSSGLKNVNSFYKDIELLMKKEEPFFLSLGIFNNIKYINEKFGHRIGDELIYKAISLIQGVLRSNTELYHFGGDEYIFIIYTDHKAEANNILKRVLKVFDREIVIDRIRTNLSITMGVVNYPNQGRNIDELIKNAHLTLSNSHILNSNAFAFYKKDSLSNNDTNSDFDHYVKNLNLELFEVYLMPIIDCASNLIVGFECLTRAFNEFDEMMHTENVVNSLERNGRIQELDETVFKKMILIMRRINKEYPNNEYFLSVNASALSFNESYVEKVIALYEKENFAKGTIVLELTESYQVEDYNYLIRLFNRLNEVGIKTAIDDFGSGYSSLSYISKFPIYAIKVDKEYVRDYHTNGFNRTLFLTLKSIAKVLECKLVAEGVDDPETLDFLKTNGCELYQGFLFSKGVTFEDGLKMIKKNRLELNIDEE